MIQFSLVKFAVDEGGKVSNSLYTWQRISQHCRVGDPLIWSSKIARSPWRYCQKILCCILSGVLQICLFQLCFVCSSFSFSSTLTCIPSVTSVSSVKSCTWSTCSRRSSSSLPGSVFQLLCNVNHLQTMFNNQLKDELGSPQQVSHWK